METTYVPNVVQGVELGGKSSMDAEELFVHDGSEGKCAERIHAGVIHTLGILALAYTRQSIKGPTTVRICRLTLEFEGEVISQMSTFVIASQEEDGIGIPDLKRPQVEYTLRGRGEARLRHQIGYFMRTSILKYPLST
jgi:hypothetical protein